VNLSDTDQRTMTTEEIVAGWKAGVVTHDAFVWKDGMGDWVAILDCAELKGLLPAPAAAPTGTPFGPTVVTAPTEGNQARLAAGARSGVDLFDATGGAPEEDDVATSAPHLPMAGGSAYDDKMTGARNENSVLFSLDSLKGGLTGGGDKKGSSPKRSAPTEDPFAMGGSELAGGASPLFSLNANQALLTAPAAPEPPPPRFDPSGAPAKPTNKLLVWGGGAAGALILLLVGLLIGRGGRSDEPAPDSSAKASASAEAEKPETKEEKKEEAKSEEKKAEPAASASAAPSAAATTPGKVSQNTGTKSPSPGTPSPGTPKPTETAKKDEVVGTAPFSVSAAQVALTQAAGNAAGCAKPGGPTGSGKATVTFAPSGRVTTANVLTPPFAGTPVGGCVAGIFRKARVPAFNGNPVTVSKSFTIR
jgi:hypothetical protein